MKKISIIIFFLTIMDLLTTVLVWIYKIVLFSYMVVGNHIIKANTFLVIVLSSKTTNKHKFPSLFRIKMYNSQRAPSTISVARVRNIPFRQHS